MQQWQVGPVPDYIYSNPPPNHPNDLHASHYPPQPDMSRRQDGHFPYGAPPPQGTAQQHHAAPVQPTMAHAQPSQAAPPQQQTPTPTPVPAPRQRKRPPPSQAQHPQVVPHAQQHQQHPQQGQHQQPPHQQGQQPQPQHQLQQHPHAQQHQTVPPQSQAQPGVASGVPTVPQTPAQQPPTAVSAAPTSGSAAAPSAANDDGNSSPNPPPAKKSRTNTPWTPAEELRLKQMRDAGNSWAEIAKTFPTRTEGSVKKHWYKDMHYAEFAEDEVFSHSQALLSAIKEYENNKWKVIGAKVGKPAKACEQYAKEHFPDLFPPPKIR